MCVCRIDVRWIPGTSTTGAFLFDSEHAGGDVVEVGETVLALRSKHTTHDPLDGDHAVHMLEIPQDSCAYWMLPSAYLYFSVVIRLYWALCISLYSGLIPQFWLICLLYRLDCAPLPYFCTGEVLWIPTEYDECCRFLLCADKGGLSATRKFLHVIAAFLLAPGRCNAEGRSVFWTVTCTVNLYLVNTARGSPDAWREVGTVQQVHDAFWIASA